MNLSGKTIFVTGGTGFIGTRLVEKLRLEHDAKVRLLVHKPGSAIRVARFDVDMVFGDLSKPSFVDHAVQGCDIVIHCALGGSSNSQDNQAVTIAGTEAIAQAVLKHDVARFVNVSTVSVYGETKDGTVDETTQPNPGELEYPKIKFAAEQCVMSLYKQHSLPVSVVRPTIVYGPYGRYWTLEPLTQLQSGRFVLPNNGGGLSNCVYVDDVADALILAATRDEAVGQTFIISGPQQVTWRQFYDAYEQMIGYRATRSLSVQEIKQIMKKRSKPVGTMDLLKRLIRDQPEVRWQLVDQSPLFLPYRVLQRITPGQTMRRFKNWLLGKDHNTASADKPQNKHTGKAPHQTTPASDHGGKENLPNATGNRPLYFPGEISIPLYSSKTHFSIDKARKMLGYDPKFDLKRGMAMTKDWAQWAHLIDSTPLS